MREWGDILQVYTLILTALGLSMDAFAVSITNAMVSARQRRKNAWITALAFGIAQGVMPMIGYFAGLSFADYIHELDHWIALVLLSFIGGKMIIDSVKEIRRRNGGGKQSIKDITVKVIIIQAIATSIDALAVGVGFAFLDVNIYFAASIIAATTFLCCLIGAGIGNRVGRLIKDKATLAGGFVLVGIGVKTLIEHLFFQ